MSRQGQILAIVTPQQIRIPRENKRKKLPESSVLIKEPIIDTVNSRKIPQEDTVTDAEKGSQHKTPQNFRHKEYYEGDTDKKKHFTDNSRTANDYCEISLDNEQGNEDYEELK